ncbi:hypothetical protein ACFL2R_02475 [Patescibacteria group bacterium]
MNSHLSKSIVSTICYYSALNYPLTAFEIWKFMIDRQDSCSMNFGDEFEKKDYSLFDVMSELENSNELWRLIGNSSGYYFLKGEECLVEERIRNDKISNIKLKRLRRVVQLLRVVPFVRMILVTGRLSMKNAEQESDWDLLVVLRDRRIWIGRTLVTLLTHFIGKRRYGRKIKDRVCLNYFLTTNSLEITDKNIFSSSEYMFCVPMFDTDGYYERFQLKNHWIKNIRMNYYISETSNLRRICDSNFSISVRKYLEKLFDLDGLESFLRKIEKKKIENNPKTKMESSFIEATDDALIFLPKPQGPLVFDKYQEKLERAMIF